MLNKFKKGDIIVCRAKVFCTERHDNKSFKAQPWEFGVVVYAHPAHNFIIYNNGLFNQGAWCSEAYSIEEWKQLKSKHRVPVRTNGFVV